MTDKEKAICFDVLMEEIEQKIKHYSKLALANIEEADAYEKVIKNNQHTPWHRGKAAVYAWVTTDLMEWKKMEVENGNDIHM